MSLVLGIDAAWTAKNPSGIALVSTETDPPKLIRASPSFEDFMLGTKPDAWCGKHEPQASLSEVLSKAAEIAGGAVTVIAVDMPVAHDQVRGRRECDNAISREFWRYKWQLTPLPNSAQQGLN
jgi:predicted RNase H-like nuclease